MYPLSTLQLLKLFSPLVEKRKTWLLLDEMTFHPPTP